MRREVNGLISNKKGEKCINLKQRHPKYRHTKTENKGRKTIRAINISFAVLPAEKAQFRGGKLEIKAVITYSNHQHITRKT